MRTILSRLLHTTSRGVATHVASLLAGFALLLTAGQSTAVNVDNFEEGSFSFSGPPGGVATQSGLSTANVLAGERITNLDTIFVADPGPATAELVLTGGDDAVAFSAESGLGTLGTRLEFVYLFPSPIDISMMGSALSIDLKSLVDSANAFSILVGVETFQAEATVEVSGLTPGTITVPFNTLVASVGSTPADLTQVTGIYFQLRTTNGAIGSVSATVDDFQIVSASSVPSLSPIAIALLGTLMGLASYWRFRA